MKKLLQFILFAFASSGGAYAQFPVVTHTAINPALHQTSRVLSTCYVDPHTIQFATISTVPTDTFCLGTTMPNLIDFFMTTPGVAYYRYYQHNVYTGANWGMNNFMPVSSDQYIPVDTGTYLMSLEIIHTGGDTCMTGEFGFQMVQVDPPYYCLPLSNLRAQSPVSNSTHGLTPIRFTSHAAGMGTLQLINIQTGAVSGGSINIRIGENLTNITTLMRPAGVYNLRISIPRQGVNGATYQVLNRNILIQ